MTFTDQDAPPRNQPRVVVTRDGSRTLVGDDGEGYKSMAGALTEAHHVYLEGSGVAERLRGRTPTRVLEIGFGTGLLFLVTAAQAEAEGTELRYVALENDPPPAQLLAALRYEDEERLAHSGLPRAFSAWRGALAEPVPAGVHRMTSGGSQLEFVVGDALELPVDGAFHAIYHDAFSPATNPRLWTQEFLTELASRLQPGGKLVTFTVAGAVRRALTAAGLRVTKRPGPPGGKREVLAAERPG